MCIKFYCLCCEIRSYAENLCCMLTGDDYCDIDRINTDDDRVVQNDAGHLNDHNDKVSS